MIIGKRCRVRGCLGDVRRHALLIPDPHVNGGGLVFQQWPDDLDPPLPGGEHGAAGQIERRVLRHDFQ